jgi:ribonucleoside-triphosphate reductase
LDSKKFGVIKGVTDNNYYTNSFHLCVSKEVSAFEKLGYESQFPYIANGGFINYVELPSMQANPWGLEQIWDHTRKIGIGYFGGNSPIDECYECNFSGEFKCTSKGFECPSCGNNTPEKVSVTRRVCGYLGSPDARPFNFGKQIEVTRRVKHFQN